MPDVSPDFLEVENRLKDKTLVARWQSQQEPDAVVHILHGMGEHKGRYQEFASFLNQNNIQVYAHDHLGHGDSISDASPEGHFHNEDGFRSAVGIVADVHDFIRDQHRDKPVFLLGHSMGSFIAQHYLVDHPSTVNGLILTGSAFTPPPLIHSFRLIAKMEALRLGKRGKSGLLNFLSFGSYNKAFQPNRTEFDWLTREDHIVDAYINDELCGFICSCGSWSQLADGLLHTYKKDSMKKIPADLPTYIICGDKDPVGGFGKYSQSLHQRWLDTGHTKVKFDLLPDVRHEVLNESNRETTYNAILQWISENSR